MQEDWLAPARLDFVYDDEEANMPIHYIALGSPVSLCAIPPPISHTHQAMPSISDA